MIKRLAFVACIAAAAFMMARAGAQNTIAGSWSLRASGTQGLVHLKMRFGEHDSDSNDLPLRDLGLTPNDLSGPPHHAAFALSRDAGSIAFDGTVGNNGGSGRFTFMPNARYAAAMAARGLALQRTEIQLAAVMLDISEGYVGDLVADGVRLSSFNRVIALRALGVSPEYVNGLASAGYRGLTDRDLIQLKALGVDAAYVRYLAAHGYRNLSVSELVRLKALKV